MSPTPLRVPAQGVEGLLRDLGSRLQRGDQALARAGNEAPRLASGLADLDARIGGGFPAGRLSEIAGPASSGRTSITHALLARTTGRGESVALVDAAQAFDVESAARGGVVLERVLWARPPAWREAVRCCECLLDARGFALVLLDLSGGVEAEAARATATWQRLARRSAGTGTPLLVLSQARTTGSQSDLVLEMRPPRAHFVGTPALLEGLSIEARVARHRSGPVHQVAQVRLSASRAA